MTVVLCVVVAYLFYRTRRLEQKVEVMWAVLSKETK